MTTLVKASVALFLAAEVFIVVAVGEDALVLVGGWALAALAVLAVALLVRNSIARVVLAAALLAGCVLFAVELGLFFVPAAGALLAAAVVEQRHLRPTHLSSRHILH